MEAVACVKLRNDECCSLCKEKIKKDMFGLLFWSSKLREPVGIYHPSCIIKVIGLSING